MNTATTGALWRGAAGALPNALAIGYATGAYAMSFLLMAAEPAWLNAIGIALCAHAMVIAAYLIHEAAHYTLFAGPAHNHIAGEAMNWIAGSACASLERIRRLHLLRHHPDRADVTCFDYKALLRSSATLRRLVTALEWAYVPAVELIMHAQIVVRPFLDRTQRRHLPRVATVMALRLALLATLAWLSPKAAVLYLAAYCVFLTTLTFFDAFHHTFDQYFTDADAPLPIGGRDRAFEQANTYSNVVSARWPLLNLLPLNVGHHNAHHERAAVPWYLLPALHAQLYGDSRRELMPLSQLLRTYHRNRLRRILDDYGEVRGVGVHRADGFIGAHGVSFLTVV